jgi:hypothetical protein
VEVEELLHELPLCHKFGRAAECPASPETRASARANYPPKGGTPNSEDPYGQSTCH